MCKKLLNLQKAFQNRRDQILCSYWITDFSDLHRELLKAGQGNLAGFEIRQKLSFEKRAAQCTPLLKAGMCQSRWF
jgi:hypothetical protein